jgi:methylmalonyl-CoA mutase C-terminal domain/subunit
MAKPGLDGHWRGMVVVSQALRDAGMEVIYGGNMTPAEIAATAVQEDVGAVGLSILAPGYMKLVGETMAELERRGLAQVPVVLGGAVFEEDVGALKAMGVREVFRPGTPLDAVVRYFKTLESSEA